jgi:hypothetical protein
MEPKTNPEYEEVQWPSLIVINEQTIVDAKQYLKSIDHKGRQFLKWDKALTKAIELWFTNYVWV